MATLPPPNAFSSFVDEPSAETLVVASRSQAPVAAASGPFDSGVSSAPSPDEAAAPFRQASDAAAEFDCLMDDICEIFAGASKLEPVEIWFENTAYPREDELLYEVLEAMDDPRVPSLREMPYGMEGLFDPAPLFLRQA